MTTIVRFTKAQLAADRQLSADAKIDIYKSSQPVGRSTKRLEMIIKETVDLGMVLAVAQSQGSVECGDYNHLIPVLKFLKKHVVQGAGQ